MNAQMRLGIDFDNTLVNYDYVFRTAAPSFALIDDGIGGRKREIRDYLRSLPNGELTWQRLQGFAYGKGISGAKPFEGVDQFLRRCRSRACDVLIVSHKTEFGHHDSDRTNLREAALSWMRAEGFFRKDVYDIPVGNVFFEATRAEKLARIAALGCTHFIDDLQEVLDDPQFPSNVRRILLSPNELQPHSSYAVCRNWNEIESLVFCDQH